MLRCITLLCLLPFLANCWDDYPVDGPCPEPPKAEDKSKWDKLAGNWWLEKGNREWLVKNPISCAQVSIKKMEDDGVINLSLAVEDKDGNHVVKERFDPIKGEPGRWLVNIFDEKTEEYVPNGYKYTIVKIDDGGVLYYGCKNEGKKHKSFYHQLVSKDDKLRKEFCENSEKDFTKVYEESKDKRKMIPIEHDNCDYQLKCLE